MKATILIPTFNRPQDLACLLNFFKSQQCEYPAFVLDASTPQNQLLNSKIVKNFKHVTHMAFDENTHMCERLAICAKEHVSTEYSIVCADDDFLIPSFIPAAIEFLDKHPDYSSVCGQTRCLAYPKRAKKYGLFSFLNHLSHSPALDQSTFLARYHCSNVLAGAGSPPLFYSMRRTDHIEKIFSMVEPTFKYSSQEILNGALTLLWGKCTTIPQLMLIRNYSSETIRESIRQDDSLYTTPEDMQKIRLIMQDELKKCKENLSDEQVEYILNQFFVVPLTQYFSHHLDEFITSFSRRIGYKKNWFFYFMNAFMPSFMNKLDTMITPDIVKSLNLAFRRSAQSNLMS